MTYYWRGQELPQRETRLQQYQRVVCTTCGANISEPCHTLTDDRKPVSMPHKERRTLARRLGFVTG